jgi:hypothetical protein
MCLRDLKNIQVFQDFTSRNIVWGWFSMLCMFHVMRFVSIFFQAEVFEDCEFHSTLCAELWRFTEPQKRWHYTSDVYVLYRMFVWPMKCVPCDSSTAVRQPYRLPLKPMLLLHGVLCPWICHPYFMERVSEGRWLFVNLRHKGGRTSVAGLACIEMSFTSTSIEHGSNRRYVSPCTLFVE